MVHDLGPLRGEIVAIRPIRGGGGPVRGEIVAIRPIRGAVRLGLLIPTHLFHPLIM